ncbi:MAG: substrate-binding domain-containing protein [Solobacterium sp.]|nr:substrate-binding domain-containing protein [Solobacterium sp.]
MKKLLKVACALGMTLSLAACGANNSTAANTTSATETTEGEAGHFVGFSAMTMGDAWMVQTGDQIKKVCDENGWKFEMQGAEGVAATQVSQIENMVTMGCDIILITPLDIDALHDVMKDANDKGVTCVYIGDPFEGEEPFSICVNVDQRDYGSQAAKAAADWIEATYPDAADGSIEVAIFQNSQVEAFVLRADGMHDIEKFTSKAKVVETYDLVGQANMNAMCQEYTDELLMKHPDVKVIISHSSDFGNAIDEVIMRTGTVDPTTMGIFADDWLEAAADAIKSSTEGKSAFRAFIDSGESSKALLDAGLGLVQPDENCQVMMELHTFTAENIDGAYALHE